MAVYCDFSRKMRLILLFAIGKDKGLLRECPTNHLPNYSSLESKFVKKNLVSLWEDYFLDDDEKSITFFVLTPQRCN